MNSFEEMINHLNKNNTPNISVAVAGDSRVLLSVKKAKEMNLANFNLVGDETIIKKCAKEINLSLDNINVIDEPDLIKACRRAVKFVSSGESQILMKGHVHTALLLKAVLDKEIGLRTGKILSHVAVFEIKEFNRLILLTDGAMNIAPTLEEKIEIINNSVEVAQALGIKIPKLAAIAAVETVNPKMPATTEGALLSKMSERGQIKKVIIEGPLALDNAISIEAANYKGIHNEVAGRADILLAPNIDVGNALYKSLIYFAKEKVGAVLSGASAPVIVTSRADSYEAKFNSIILAILLVEKQ